MQNHSGGGNVVKSLIPQFNQTGEPEAHTGTDTHGGASVPARNTGTASLSASATSATGSDATGTTSDSAAVVLRVHDTSTFASFHVQVKRPAESIKEEDRAPEAAWNWFNDGTEYTTANALTWVNVDSDPSQAISKGKMHPKNYHHKRSAYIEGLTRIRRDIAGLMFKDIQTDDFYSMLSPEDLANYGREADRHSVHLRDLIKCLPTENIAAGHAVINEMHIFDTQLALSQAIAYPNRARQLLVTTGPSVEDLTALGPYIPTFEDSAGMSSEHTGSSHVLLTNLCFTTMYDASNYNKH